MANITNNAVANMVNLGQYGGFYASTAGTAAVTVPAGYVIVAVTSLNDNTQVGNADTGFPQMGTVAIPKGATLYGRWSAMTIAGTGGAAVAYFAPKD